MACRHFLELQKLALDRAHPGHKAVEFSEKDLLVLPSLLDLVNRRAVADALEGFGQAPVQKPHGPLQIQEFLM